MSVIYDKYADLYDIAFNWDIEDEVDWLLARLGPGCQSVLEPACGSGRMFPPFARRGVRVTGIELSKRMRELASSRMARLRLSEPRIELADMSDFELGERFDGAILPINSLGHLPTHAQAAKHLEAVARHLKPGAKYLMQVDLRDVTEHLPERDNNEGAWESESDGELLRTTWGVKSFDPATHFETQFTRFEVLSGPRQGETVEAEHRMLAWGWETWKAQVTASPFRQTAAYDGNQKGRPRLELGPALERACLTWHELTLS